MTIEERAREICATLIPHTTSVHNVNVLIEALREEIRLALEEACNESCLNCSKGEDAAFWSNVYNAENAMKIRCRLMAAERMAIVVKSIITNIRFPDNCHGDFVALNKMLGEWEDLK